jgi:peptidoglycan-associated lipoprotein
MIFAGLKSKVYGVLALTLFMTACSGGQDDASMPVTEPPVVEEEVAVIQTPVVQQKDADEVVPGSQRELEAMAGRRVFFGYDQYDLTSQAQQVLRNQAAWLKQYPNKNIIIEGHCDERGTREYNLALGARRAAATRRYLTVLGIDASRIRTISYGKERPEVAASNRTSWARNRRAVTLVE